MTLPLFIHKNNRLLMALLCGVVFYFCYTIPNRYHLFEPQLLSLTGYDRAVPLMPWTIFIYITEYFLFVSAYFSFKEELNRNRYIWSYFGVLFFSMLFFVFYPTTYPRADYPIPLDTHWLTYYTFQGLRMLDDPSNSFPSLHVSCCFLTAFAFLPKPESRKNFWFYFIWSFLIAASTLTTKQHYIIDVFSGVIASVAGYWIFFKKTKYVPLAKFVRRFKQLEI